eukprot:scaffold193965_cov39-Tisochrysis_lutea.AAC.1
MQPSLLAAALEVLARDQAQVVHRDTRQSTKHLASLLEVHPLIYASRLAWRLSRRGVREFVPSASAHMHLDELIGVIHVEECPHRCLGWVELPPCPHCQSGHPPVLEFSKTMQRRNVERVVLASSCAAPISSGDGAHDNSPCENKVASIASPCCCLLDFSTQGIVCNTH